MPATNAAGKSSPTAIVAAKRDAREMPRGRLQCRCCSLHRERIRKMLREKVFGVFPSASSTGTTGGRPVWIDGRGASRSVVEVRGAPGAEPFIGGRDASPSVVEVPVSLESDISVGCCGGLGGAVDEVDGWWAVVIDVVVCGVFDFLEFESAAFHSAGAGAVAAGGVEAFSDFSQCVAGCGVQGVRGKNPPGR